MKALLNSFKLFLNFLNRFDKDFLSCVFQLSEDTIAVVGAEISSGVV